MDLQWRDKVTEGQVDQSLTAKSTAVLDVREDSLRLVWQVQLEFGRAFRDAFTFAVPADYLVEQVTGENLRGWTVKNVGTEQTLDVTLLKPAQGTRDDHDPTRPPRPRGARASWPSSTPRRVLVVDAALQQGEIAVRRSPRLDLRTVASTGLARADADGQTAAVEQLADTTDAAVLNVRPFQTFRFVRPPFSLRLAASELANTTTADVRAALRIAERDTTLDAAVVFRSQGQPLYRVELFLPQGFELDRLGPGDLEWAVTTENDRKKLTVHLLEGHTGDFTLTLFGRIVGVGDPPAADGEPKARTIPAPVIEVLNVQKQEGDLVVLPDPDTDVRMEEIKNADSVLLMQAIGWLAAEQQHLAKGALRFRSPDYARPPGAHAAHAAGLGPHHHQRQGDAAGHPGNDPAELQDRAGRHSPPLVPAARGAGQGSPERQAAQGAGRRAGHQCCRPADSRLGPFSAGAAGLCPRRVRRDRHARPPAHRRQAAHRHPAGRNGPHRPAAGGDRECRPR